MQTEIKESRDKNAVASLLERTQKPEVRTVYSEALRRAVLKYLDVIFNQENPPSIISQLKARHATFYFDGSVLRGNVSDATHDIDVFMVSDGQPPLSYQESTSLRDIENYHPQHQDFSDFVISTQNQDPHLESFVEARKIKILKRVAFDAKASGRAFKEPDIQNTSIVDLDTETVTKGALLEMIESGDITQLLQEEPPRVKFLLEVLLTKSASDVYDTSPGNVTNLQKSLVEKLLSLKNTNLERFTAVWTVIETAFVNIHRSTEKRYPSRDLRLLIDYGLRMYQEKHQQSLLNTLSREQAEHILIRKMLAKPMIEAAQLDEVLSEERMMKYLRGVIGTYGSPEFITVEEGLQMIQNPNYQEQLMQGLSAQQLLELAKFERIISLYKVIRGQERLPSIEEFGKYFGVDGS